MNPVRFLGFFLLAASATAAAQVAAARDSHQRVTFENAQFRIIDVNVPTGRSSEEHRHEFDIATVSMNAGTETREHVAGRAASARLPRPAGHASFVEYTGTPASHRTENTGALAHHLYAVEKLKKNGWSTAAPAKGLATTPVSESRAFRIYDVRLSKDASQTAHTHAVPTIAVLVSGKAMSDGPDAQAKALAPAPVGLRQIEQPGQWILVPAGDTHHLVRLGVEDAHVVEIEVR